MRSDATTSCTTTNITIFARRKSYKVIAHNKEFGKDAVAGALYVRKDSGITALAQLRGRTMLFGGGKDAMLSYIAPVYMMMQAGLKKEDFKIEFAVNPPNAVLASTTSRPTPPVLATRRSSSRW